MDLSLPIVISGGILAYLISSKEKRESFKLRDKIHSNLMPIGKNLFDTDIVRENRNYLQKKANQRELLSKDTKNTGIIPRTRQIECINTCGEKYSVLPYDITDNRQIVKDQTKDSILNGPMFATNEIIAPQKESYENISQMAGGNVKLSLQENMVPMFGSSVKSSYAKDTAERLTGNDSIYRSKEAVESFNPLVKQDVFGSILPRDTTRFFVSDQKNGILPFPQQKVIPMDALSFRPMPSTSEALNVNPREIYKSRDTGGGFKFASISEQAPVNKNGQERFYEVDEPKGNFSTIVKKDSINPEIIKSCSKKGLLDPESDRNYKYNSKYTRNNLPSKLQESTKNTLIDVDYKSQKVTVKDDNYNRDALFIRAQERETVNSTRPGYITQKIQMAAENYIVDLPVSSKEKLLYEYKGIPDAAVKRQMRQDHCTTVGSAKIIIEQDKYKINEGLKQTNTTLKNTRNSKSIIEDRDAISSNSYSMSPRKECGTRSNNKIDIGEIHQIRTGNNGNIYKA
jgi:hypothetical protein